MNYLILSHLHLGNYGGMLQSFALMNIINTMGRAVSLGNYEQKEERKTLKRILYVWYQRLFRSKKLKNIEEREKSFFSIAQSFSKFVRWSNVLDNQVDAFVVGSDQVWRSGYARWLRSLPFFFLNFRDSKLGFRGA